MKKAFISICAIVLFFFGVPAAFAESPVPENCTISSDLAYKYAGSSAVFYVDSACTKRRFRHEDVFFTYFYSWNDVRTIPRMVLEDVPDNALGFMPLGPLYNPLPGTLMKSVDDPKVYVRLTTGLYWIGSGEVFDALGYEWDWVQDVDIRLITNFAQPTIINSAERHVDGTIFKYPNSPRVYVLENGQKRYIVSADVFDALGYRWDRILTISSSFVYPDGPDKEYNDAPIILRAR